MICTCVGTGDVHGGSWQIFVWNPAAGQSVLKLQHLSNFVLRDGMGARKAGSVS